MTNLKFYRESFAIIYNVWGWFANVDRTKRTNLSFAMYILMKEFQILRF